MSTLHAFYVGKLILFNLIFFSLIYRNKLLKLNVTGSLTAILSLCPKYGHKRSNIKVFHY